MIRRFHSIPVAAAALCFTLLPDRSSAADEPEVPAAVQVEVNFTSGGEKVVAKAVLHTDLQDQGKSFEGTVTLNSGDGMRWIVSISATITADGGEPAISVSVSDANRTVKAEREGSSSIEPLEIFHSERAWQGPGVYRVVEQDDKVLSLRVRDTPELQQQQAAAPAPVPEKKGKERK